MYFLNGTYNFNLEDNIVINYLNELKEKYSNRDDILKNIDNLIIIVKLFEVRKVYRRKYFLITLESSIRRLLAYTNLFLILELKVDIKYSIERIDSVISDIEDLEEEGVKEIKKLRALTRDISFIPANRDTSLRFSIDIPREVYTLSSTIKENFSDRRLVVEIIIELDKFIKANTLLIYFRSKYLLLSLYILDYRTYSNYLFSECEGSRIT